MMHRRELLTILCVVLCGMCSLTYQEDPHVNLRGAGSSMPSEVYKSWIAGYKTHRKGFQLLNTLYEPVGSLNGKYWMEDAKNYSHDIEYASVTGDEAELHDDDYAKFPDLQMFPTMAG